MEKEQPSLWPSDQTNPFGEILANPMNTFIETLENRALQKLSTGEVFDSIIVEFQECLENAQIKEKNSKHFKAKKKKTKLVVEVKPLQIKNNLKQQWWNITDKLLTVFVGLLL